jgi:hypothetical protein
MKIMSKLTQIVEEKPSHEKPTDKLVVDVAEAISKAIKAFHKNSDRHVLVLEGKLSEPEKHIIYHLADLIRKAGNDLTTIMKNNYEQLVRTKRYRKLQNLYQKAVKAKDETKRKNLVKQMKEMQVQYNVTWDFCRTAMQPIAKKYGIDAVFGLTKAEDVWAGVEKCLYGNGKTLHFTVKGDLPCIRAKQPSRGIVLKSTKDGLEFKLKDIRFKPILKDRFHKDEVNAILYYLANSESMDKMAARVFCDRGLCISTYRPCYASLVCKTIRGKLRVFVHITIEGKTKPKYDRNGNLKHKRGIGIVGCDIGPSTIAYTSDKEVGLKNLAERGDSINRAERQERLSYRKMDRSRRANNPDNYNDDGTIKTGKKTWKKSNRYRKEQERHQNLCRKASINRHLAIEEEVNHLRELGDTFVTEPKNSAKLAKRAKKTTVNKNGKINRKKRHGKSIKNRCPGYFQAHAKMKFKNYIEVPMDYRASQYDHTADDYIKKKLSQRIFTLTDGTIVQRDWYSSFLMYCIDLATGKINKQKCIDLFNVKYALEVALINFIKANNIKIMNSGIKVKNAA